jgi:single-stranded-DNA-specific exonuclease
MWKLREIDHQKVRKISEHFSFSKTVSQILVARGYDTTEKVQKFITISLEQLGSPFVMSGMTEACDRLCKAIAEKQNIMIHGDFDADGITSSALLTLFLREIDVPVETFIPNRLDEGHGLAQRFIGLAIEKKVNLVITCDCGSSNEKEILQLHEAGIDTIVTDHHHISKPIPHAIVVNPKLQHNDEEQPEELSGVGVVFMLLMGLRKKLRDANFFKDVEPNLKKYLDIVALGTIADMAPLIGHNRVLVTKGLEELQKSIRPGIVAMKEKAGIDSTQTFVAADVGFRLAPRINAATRLGYSMEAFEMMVSDHPLTVLHLSSKMEEWNASRKKIQSKMFDQCQKEMSRQIELGYQVLVFASKDFHPGVIGLTAQKIASESLIPCFVFNVDGEIAKGSARCRSPFHLVNIMDGVKDLLGEFGGHSEAGGCRMKLGNLQEFTRRIQDIAKAQLSVSEKPALWIDAVIEPSDLSISLIRDVQKLGPFGIGNPEPMFQSRLQVMGQPREVGQNHLQATVLLPSGGTAKCIAFGKYNAWKTDFQGVVNLYYHLQENIWQGKSSISLQIQGFSR